MSVFDYFHMVVLSVLLKIEGFVSPHLRSDAADAS